MRGKVFLPFVGSRHTGITPACAGKSTPSLAVFGLHRDHPRVCGEKVCKEIAPLSVWGSPPRVRGKVHTSHQRTRQAGITPACAGKREIVVVQITVIQDHPRVCGEKAVELILSCHSLGSPPRVRGKVCNVCAIVNHLGITPACAGKSEYNLPDHDNLQDHPRVCGEKISRYVEYGTLVGSPPRVRGKETNIRINTASEGITPACAGKRLKRSHSIGHFSCILCLFHSVLHRASVSGGSRAGPCAPPCLPAQNAVPV